MHNKFLICAFLFINLIFLVYSDECAGEIKFYDKGGILELKGNEICKFAWTSSMSFENCHYGCGDLDVYPIWNSGDGLHIITGEVGEWNLENKFSFKTKSGRVCNKRMTRRVKIINGPEDPCLKPNACGANANCEFDITQPMCKSCSCRFGCSGDPYSGCNDGNVEMCRLFSHLCPSHTHCEEKPCPEIFGCLCNAGYELTPTSAPKLDCKNENDCKFVPNNKHVCRDKNECNDKYNCPPNSHCVNDIYKGDGCGDRYPDQYPNHINAERCGYHCECDNGFSINDKNGQCERKCDKKCPPDAYCRFMNGIPTCVCKIPGHVFNPRTNICDPIDICTNNPSICEREKPNSDCQYTGPEKYNCVCKDGYREIRKDGRKICVKVGVCDSENTHNCHKNIRKGEVRRNFNKNVHVANSYCEDDDSSKKFKCVCEEGFDEYFTSKGQYCLRRNNDEWKFELIGDNPMTLPHLTKHFIDPSYFFQMLGPYKNAPHTKFPEAGLCSPLQTCGRFKVDYVLDTKDSALSGYSHINDEELKRMIKNRVIPLDSRTINVWPINYCDENLSSYVDYVINPETKERFPLKERVEIELGRLNIRKCAKYASCRMNEARTLPEACGYSCPCWRNHQFTPYEPELFGQENECRYPKNPHIYFLRGFNATIPSTSLNRELLKIDDLSNVNIFPMDGVCIVCEHKFGQQLDTIKIKDKLSAHTDDHKAFYPYPELIKRNNGIYELNQVIYPEVRWEKIQIVDVKEVDVSKMSKDTLYSFVRERELLEKCDYQKGCIAVYVVTYYTKEDGSDTQKRIVYTPIKNVELYIDKVRDIVYWWDKFYQILIIFLILASIYIAFLLFSRLYSCFQYFVLGKNDKNNARIAWDTVYLFRHPFNAQARNQLVYQALYMD